MHKCMLNHACVEQVWNVNFIDQCDFKLLKRIKGRLTRKCNVTCDECVEAIARKCWIRLNASEWFERPCGVARLLKELTPGADDGFFAFIDHSAWNLEGELVAAKSVLPDHDDLTLRCDGNDVAPVWAAHGVNVAALLAVAIEEIAVVDREDSKVAYFTRLSE